MVLDSLQTYKNLKKKGFRDAPGDHKFLDFFYNGKLVLTTKISHGATHYLADDLIKSMATQCKITKKQFFDLATCTLSEEGYIQALKHIAGLLE